HEAGHAFFLTIMAKGVRSVSIRPRGNSLGQCEPVPFKPKKTYESMRNIWACFLVGGIVEGKITGDTDVGGSTGDLDTLAATCSGSGLPTETALAMFEEITAAIEKYLEHPEVWAAITRIAEELLRRHRITGKTVRKLIEAEFEEAA